jgi:2,3-bisphosphoglycerate-dependent phosphoglycerate mutase
VLPFWNERVLPSLSQGKRIVIAAHGNSLRGLVKMLDGISDEDIVGLNIPNGLPLVYELDGQGRALGRRYLGEAAG